MGRNIINIMGNFEINKRKNGEFQFNLKASNGQIILSSEGYPRKVSCIDGVQSVKRFAQDDNRFDRRKSTSGKFYFNLKAGNGQVIGVSEMYETEMSMNRGIESVKTNALTAPLKDLT